MRKLLIVVFSLKSIFLYAQDCDRIFRTTITYSNSELGLNYVNEAQSFRYKVYKRTTGDVTSASCDLLDIKRPIIICEGYDTQNEISTSDIYDYYINKNSHGDALRKLGYDIITYNLNTPESALQPNAILFAKFIEFINNNKVGNEENVVMGVSMGGILSRYALAHMEKNKIPHNTRLFISFDSPHQGANVPLSLQALIFELRYEGVIGSFLGQPALVNLYQQLISHGTEQLISNYVKTIANKKSYPHKYRTSFMQELNSLTNSFGYPENCRKIAISNGSYKKDMQKALPGNPAAAYSGNPAIIFQYSTLWGTITRSWVLCTAPGVDNWALDGMDVCVLYKNKMCDIIDQEGSSIYALRNTECPLDHSPGGYYPWFEIIYKTINDVSGDKILKYNENACFIPTISALDLNTDDKLLKISKYTKSQILADSPFDEIWWDPAQDNLAHTELTSNMGEWLYNQIVRNKDNYSGIADLDIKDVIISKNSVYKASSSISISNATLLDKIDLTTVASNSITLKPGFDAPAGSIFTASLEKVIQSKKVLANQLPKFRPQSTLRQSAGNNLVFSKLINTQLLTYAVPNDDLNYFEKEHIEYSIYPNPSNGIFSIKMALKDNIEFVGLEILDGLGRSHFSAKYRASDLIDYQINLEELSSGIYTLKIKADNKLVIKKIEIIK